MRILMLNHNVAWKGGTFSRVIHLARLLARAGHEPTVMAISPRRRFSFEFEDRDGVLLIHTPDLFWGSGRTGWDPFDALIRTTHAGRRWYDLVYAFDARPVVLVPALVVARRQRIPLAMDWADWWGRGGTIEERANRLVSRLLGPFEEWLEEAFRGRAELNTVISEALLARALELGLPRDRLLRVPNGCDTGGGPIGRRESRERLGLPLDVPLVGHLGRIYPRDAALLAAAMGHLAGTVPGCLLVLVGDSRVPRRIFAPIEPMLLTPGFVPDETLPLWLSSCDVLLLPLADSLANRGRWPGKLNDYLAAGRPVVATSVGDAAGWLAAFPIGALAPPEAEAFATTTAALLGDPDRIAAYGAEARRLAENELSWDVVARPLLAALEDLAASGV